MRADRPAVPHDPPRAGDVYVRVHTADGVFRVHYDAGEPSWVQSEYAAGCADIGVPATEAKAAHRAAIAAAENFLAGFR